MRVCTNAHPMVLSLVALCFGLFNLNAPFTQAQTTAPKSAAPAAPAVPTVSASGQALDEDFAKSVKEWTTKPEFLSPLVDHLPKASGVPMPKDVLGYHIGTPKKLTPTAEIYKFYRALAAASPRVKVIEVGKTDEGRDCIIVFVSAQENLANLETHRAALAQLADPRNLTPAQAKELIAKTKPIYHFSAGLHSAETGPPEMLMELAYRLAVEDTPLINAIRENVIVSLAPVAEPDGRDRYVDWYYRHKLEEKSEQDSNGGPPFWGKYIFHDNNRDINYSQVTMRNWLNWYLQWHPPIWHDLHESVPFLYTFSGQAPQQPGLDPILYGELPWFANFEMAQLTKYGMPGVWTHGFVDMWSPGYLAFTASNHNGLVRMYETFGNGGANTMKRRVAPEGVAGATAREWYRPLPPYKEVEWSMRNNTNYMQTGVLSALQLTSQFPAVVLENFYRKSLNSIEAGKHEAPHGFVIPAGQPDLTRVVTLVNMLRTHGIEVGRATTEIKVKEGNYPAGSYVIKRDQPYGRLAKILLEKQNFPDPNLRTYDDTGWTMGLMHHTIVKESADPAILTIVAPLVNKAELKGNVIGTALAGYAIPNYGSNQLITLRYRLKEMKVQAAEQSFTVGTQTLPAGSYVVSATGDDAGKKIRAAVEPLGLNAIALPTIPNVALHDVDLPRLAMFSTWGSTQEVGWVRHAFDQFEIKYELIYKERIKQGNLRDAYDVILIPNQGRSGKGLVFDLEPKAKPLAYTKSDQFKSHGLYGESEDITGGMGLAGAAELHKFVEAGGLLITLGQASFFPPEFGLTRTLEASRPSTQFYAPGPIIEAEILQPNVPIFYGYTNKTIAVRYGNGPLLSVPEKDRAQQILLRYPGGEKGVLSGLMRGAGEITNRPAIVHVPIGKGSVLLFAGNPCYRWQNHGEFGLLFNAVLHHNDLKK